MMANVKLKANLSSLKSKVNLPLNISASEYVLNKVQKIYPMKGKVTKTVKHGNHVIMG